MERTVPVASPFCALDPRTLLLAAAGAAVCFSIIQTIPIACACLGVALFLLTLGRPSFVPLLKRLAAANFFLLFLWATVPFSVPGETLTTFGNFDISREGVELTLAVTVKCNAILLCFIVFVAGVSLPLIGCSLERLRVPAKLVFLFLFTARYIHVIAEEWQKLQTSAKLRGFKANTSLHTYRTIGNMLGLTVINSIDRSRRIYESMLLRGFDSKFHTVTELKAGRGDMIFAVVFSLTLACLLTADIYLRLHNV